MTPLPSIAQVLMTRDKMTRQEAEERVMEVHLMWTSDPSQDPEELCRDEFGLEPDFIEDILYPPHLNQ